MTPLSATLAVGGTRYVPEPDAIARDYLLLALRLDAHAAGLVDAYVGPALLKAQVDLEQLRPPARLSEDARSLRERVTTEVAEPDRRGWLIGQLDALETQAAVLAGESISYQDQVARYLGFEPIRRDDAVFGAARATLDALLPGTGTLRERLAAWDRSVEVPVARLGGAVEGLVDRLRDRSATVFGLPDGEGVRVSLVSGQPWGAYCWFDGGGRSRIDINTDLPARAPSLLATIAHETYPGHHLEHAWKEQTLVAGMGRLEASIMLINTPECPMSEGLADLGISVLLDDDERTAWLADLLATAVAGALADPGAARDAAKLARAIAEPRRILDAARGNAALHRHADGWSHDSVVDYLVDVGGAPRERAEKMLEFIEHPLWRSYVYVYSDGEDLLRRWVEIDGATERTARFDRLLREQLAPSAILADLADAQGDRSSD